MTTFSTHYSVLCFSTKEYILETVPYQHIQSCLIHPRAKTYPVTTGVVLVKRSPTGGQRVASAFFYYNQYCNEHL